MPWWGILLLILFCDWSALAILGRHLTKRATKAVEEGVTNVKAGLMQMVPVLLARHQSTVERVLDQVVPEQVEQR